VSTSLARWTFVPLGLALVLGLWLAADGRLSGDEPGYLYAAAYQSVPQILAGEVQPTGIPDFLQGRVLHLLFLKGVMAMTGTGAEGFRALQVIHLAIAALNVLLIGAIARRLLPQVAETRTAMVLVAMTPIVLYFALKTTADNEALLAALVATLGLLTVASRRGVAGPVAIVLGLVAAALTKNQMIFVPAAFWIAASLVPIGGVDCRRLALHGAAWGAAAGIATVALLEVLGIGIANYLGSYASPFHNRTPLVAKLMNLGTELGLLWLLLPAALLSHRRRELGFFALWFVVAMTPLLFLSGVEPRHVAVNLAAAGGLAALALEAILHRWQGWHDLGGPARALLATIGVLVLMACHGLALAIMPHKVDLKTLNESLSGLDAHYGPDGYTLVASNGYADFHVLRVLWPERKVLNAGTAEFAIDTARAPREALLEAYLGDRHVEDLEGLARVDGPAVFFGFRRTFAAANMDKFLSAVSPALAARVLGGVSLDEHLYAGFSAWLWDSPEVRLEPILQAGNYQALEIHLQRRGE
jgi:hypothetical protein